MMQVPLQSRPDRIVKSERLARNENSSGQIPVLYICYMVGQHDRAAILRERKAPNMKQLRSRFRSDWGHLGKIRQSRVFMG
jgi:hypothetical protein